MPRRDQEAGEQELARARKDNGEKSSAHPTAGQLNVSDEGVAASHLNAAVDCSNHGDYDGVHAGREQSHGQSERADGRQKHQLDDPRVL